MHKKLCKISASRLLQKWYNPFCKKCSLTHFSELKRFLVRFDAISRRNYLSFISLIELLQSFSKIFGEENFIMAMFHFRLKSDKKPNVTSISAVQHVDYIQREGRFKNIDQLQDNNTFVGNFISSTEIKDAFGVRNALLYKTDDFGSIRNSAQGIEVTENASPTTLSIVLMLADEI